MLFGIFNDFLKYVFKKKKFIVLVISKKNKCEM